MDPRNNGTHRTAPAAVHPDVPANWNVTDRRIVGYLDAMEKLRHGTLDLRSRTYLLYLRMHNDGHPQRGKYGGALSQAYRYLCMATEQIDSALYQHERVF
jgi:hypothetical protein